MDPPHFEHEPREGHGLLDLRLGRTAVTDIVERWYASGVPAMKPKARASYRGLIDVRIAAHNCSHT